VQRFLVDAALKRSLERGKQSGKVIDQLTSVVDCDGMNSPVRGEVSSLFSVVEFYACPTLLINLRARHGPPLPSAALQRHVQAE